MFASSFDFTTIEGNTFNHVACGLDSGNIGLASCVLYVAIKKDDFANRIIVKIGIENHNGSVALKNSSFQSGCRRSALF